MNPAAPKTMKAAVIDRFGGPELLHVAEIPVPELDGNEILIRVDTSGRDGTDLVRRNLHIDAAID